MEPVTAMRKLTFTRGLPRGVHATFTHEGEDWIAIPASKYQRIHACIDRMLGVQRRVNDGLIAWIISHPADAERVAMLLNHLKVGIALAEQEPDAKIAAFTDRPDRRTTPISQGAAPTPRRRRPIRKQR